MVSFCNNGDESLGSVNAGNYLTNSAITDLSRKILQRGIIIIIIGGSGGSSSSSSSSSSTQ